MYHGRIVDVSAPPGTPGDTTNEKDTFGMICVQEANPTDIEPIPVYIGRRGSYTEMDCRFLCRQIAQTIKCMHENGMAHRNLHMENILADQWVRNCKKMEENKERECCGLLNQKSPSTRGK